MATMSERRRSFCIAAKTPPRSYFVWIAWRAELGDAGPVLISGLAELGPPRDFFP